MRRLSSGLLCLSILALATLGSLVLAGGATAQQTVAPPGNSGVDQYFETLPAAGGNVGVHPPAPVSPPSGAGGGAASAGLARLGRDGRAAAALAAATRPARAAGGGPAVGSTPVAGAGFAPAPQAATASSPVIGLLGGSDGGGLGPLLPIALIGALVAAVALALGRRRRARGAAGGGGGPA